MTILSIDIYYVDEILKKSFLVSYTHPLPARNLESSKRSVSRVYSHAY